MAAFRASDNVQSGDVACVMLSIVDDDILEPMVQFLVLFQISPLVNEPQDAPDFTRVLVIDTTAQGIQPDLYRGVNFTKVILVCILLEHLFC